MDTSVRLAARSLADEGGTSSSPPIAPARAQSPADALPSPKAGRHSDLLAAPFTLGLGTERALGGGRQRATRVLRDNHEPPEEDDRAPPRVDLPSSLRPLVVLSFERDFGAVKRPALGQSQPILSPR